MAIPDGLLACPHCHAPLVVSGAMIRCAAGHAFDIARQGYVNLLPGDARPGTADTPAMVAARAAFLSAGHFAPIADAVADAVAASLRDTPGCITDVGAGTGYYLAAVLGRVTSRTGVALDISKHAARRAAAAHPRIAAVVCDAWGTLPLPDASAAVVMDVFAPRNPAEFARVLHPDGALVVVTPTADHLCELVRALGLVTVDPEKEERLERSLGPGFVRTRTESVEASLMLGAADVATAVAMGPSARHVSPDALERGIAELGDRIETRIAVRVSVWRGKDAV